MAIEKDFLPNKTNKINNNMALAENKTPRTPEDIKKAKAARIKEHAKVMLANIIAVGYPNVVGLLKAAPSEEDQRAIKKGLCSSASVLAILAASEFEDAWKKGKGEFLAD